MVPSRRTQASRVVHHLLVGEGEYQPAEHASSAGAVHRAAVAAVCAWVPCPATSAIAR